MLILVRRAQICNTLIVSTLASCQKLPATVPDLANRPRQLVFLTPLNSQLNDFLNEVHQIARLEPSIVERIDEDLDLHAKKKKLLRLIDAQFLAGQTPDFGCRTVFSAVNGHSLRFKYRATTGTSILSC